MRRRSFIDLSSEPAIRQTLWCIEAELDQWYSYVHFGLLGEICRHTRKDQRYYQRKFCSWISRRDRIKFQHAELLI